MTPSTRQMSLSFALSCSLFVIFSTPCTSWCLPKSYTQPAILAKVCYSRSCAKQDHSTIFSRREKHLIRPISSSTSLFLFGWGENKEDKERKKGQDLDSWLSDPDQGPGSNATESMMEQFKKSQQIGKRTASLMEDLASTTITGSGPGGRVKVFVSGHQRPKGIDIDDNYLREVSPEDLVADITAAMQDAHAKSAEQMQKKMQALYADLSLTAP